jgi:adenylate cyclase
MGQSLHNQIRQEMEPSRETTVLFADVSGSTKLYETAGDRIALEAIGRCIEQLTAATLAAGGRVVKTIGDEVMALFPGPDAAAIAAAAMQGGMQSLPAVGDTKLGLRVGFHTGPVLQKDGDVFGDTVNLAARLVEQAVKGQVITSEETTELLAPLYKTWTRRLYPIEVKGKAGPVVLCELIWTTEGDVTVMASGNISRPAKVALRLKYRGQELVRRRDVETVTLGREETCGLVVTDIKASRQHCSIERRQDKFVLKDHSSNGTYVHIDGDKEVLLQREEITLRKHGWIALGLPRSETAEVVEYFCE